MWAWPYFCQAQHQLSSSKLGVLRQKTYMNSLSLSPALFEQEANHMVYGLPPLNLKTCISLLKQCKTLKTLKSIHASIFRSHLHLNLFLSTNLISQYSSLNHMHYAFAVFSAAPSPDVFLWNVLIRGFADTGHPHRAISLYHRMREAGVEPDNFTFPFVLKACAGLGDVDEGERVHSDAAEFGCESNVFVGNSLVSMYGKCGRVEAARRVFDRMLERNVVSWSAMVGAFVQNGCFGDAMELFWRMVEERVRPNRVTVLNLVPGVCRMSEADEIYRVVVENGLDSDICIQNAVMVMYSKCGRVDLARGFFDKIAQKDLVSWSSMIEAYARADMPMEALELFQQMKIQRIFPDYVTVLSVISASLNLASLRQARFIHCFIVRSLFEGQSVVETAMIDLYMKCGSTEYARRIFDRMHEQNLISWSTMIAGYGMHGQGKDALEIFDRFKCSMKPDHITFVSLLSACSHAGLIAEGWQCFNSMTREFGIVPRTEHYTCMVDLLGRAGHLKEAQEFIQSMPIKPDSGVWGALLGACRIHSNVKLAEFAAKSLLELDPENSGRYVLLSNIYRSLGKIEEANRVRGLMKQRGVKKSAGLTFIEVKNKLYKFTVGDRSNPQSDLIYRELEVLMERIREAGYIPDTNCVLYDVDEEMKEKMLYLHSEKLAIVFGLLNSGPETAIRIMKNLRVCGDCHTATKFISAVTGREIVVRDAHRFHHFIRGICSCGDYW